jgi:hypothetical protein
MSANKSQWPSTGLRIGSLRPGRCRVAVGTVLIVSVFLGELDLTTTVDGHHAGEPGLGGDR